MSTYLQLCQKLVSEAINSLAGGPSTVVGQTGLLGNVVTWVNDAWRDIQIERNDWRWMRSGFTVNTVAGDDTYAFGDCTDIKTSAAITRFKRWLMDNRKTPVKIYLTSGGVGGQRFLTYVPYDEWKLLYKFGVQQTQQSQPMHVSVDDDDRLVIGPIPNDIYTLTGDYQRGVQVLSADGDIPDLPGDYHDLIVYYALQRYAAKAVAPEVIARVQVEGTRLHTALKSSQAPKLMLGGPLA